jgi:hypothetical protein
LSRIGSTVPRTGHSLYGRLLDNYNPHFGRLVIRSLNPKNPGIDGIVNIFVGGNRDSFESAHRLEEVWKKGYIHSSSPAVFQISLNAPSTLSFISAALSLPPIFNHRSSFSVVPDGIVIPGNNLLITPNGSRLENPRPHNVSRKS